MFDELILIMLKLTQRTKTKKGKLMKLFKKMNSKGFSHIEILIVAIVIALVGAIGYTVWQRSVSSKPDSQAETALNWAPVYRLQVNYPGTDKVKHFEYVKGTDEMKQMIDEGDGDVENKNVAFLAYELSANKGSRVYELTAEGSGKRTDVTGNLNGTKTVVYTAKPSLVRTLERGGGYLGDGFDNNGAIFKLYKSPKRGHKKVTRLWKTVTSNGRRLYVYSDSSSNIAVFKSQGYRIDNSEKLYGLSQSAKCDLINRPKYGDICLPKTPPAIPVLNNEEYGRVFACKNEDNFYKGITYSFDGENAKSLRVIWGSTRGDGSGINSTTGELPNIATVKNALYNSGEIHSGTPLAGNQNVWGFYLTNKSNQVKRSDNVNHRTLTTCPN